jgi:tryptophan-rich sensory protein
MNNYLKLITSLAAPIMIGATSGYATVTWIESWYMTLNKPGFNPPNWIFAPVWSILYLMIWFSAFLIWKKFGDFNKIPFEAKAIYAIQLALNFFWSIAFFGLENPLLGLIVIISLWFVIIRNIYVFYSEEKFAWLLLIPYLFWVSFALVLNFYIFILN